MNPLSPARVVVIVDAPAGDEEKTLHGVARGDDSPLVCDPDRLGRRGTTSGSADVPTPEG